MSGTPPEGDAGWLRYEGDERAPSGSETGVPDQQPPAGVATDPAWLRHDLPDPDATGATPGSDAGSSTDPRAVTDAGDAADPRTGTSGRSPDSPWLAPEVEVTRAAPVPTAGEPGGTGVPATVVGAAEESTPAHVSTHTRPLPEEIAVARSRDGSEPPGDSPVDAGPGAHEGTADDDRTRSKADEPESVGGLAVLGAAVKEFAIVVGMALVLSFIVKTWLLQAFYIPSGSMEDTLVLNDRVIVSKLTPGPIDLKRGDIIVFADPGQWLDETPAAKKGPVATAVTETLTFVGLLPDNSENHLIKRVIGLPGDHVVCCDEGGRITINGKAIREPYLKPGDAASDQDFDITVPKGRVWVMGDHRSNSADSRAHDGPENDGSQGSVDERLIVGRAVALVWPFDHLTWLSNPTATFTNVPAPSSDGAGAPQGTGGADGDGADGGGGGEVGGSDSPTGSG